MAAPTIGCFVMYPSPGAVERMGPDWDFFWLDGQHGQLGYQDMLALVRACDLVRKPGFVRVPSHEKGAIGLALDMGAAGVVVPQVNSVEEAREVVRAAKFPPLGERSYGGRRPIDLHGRGYAATANQDTLLIVQIESPEGLTQLEAIAAVPGVDVLNIGPDDVKLRQGGSMTVPRSADETRALLKVLCPACRKHGKRSASVAATPESMAISVEMGADFIIAGSDVGFLAAASRQASEEARRACNRETPQAAKPSGGQGSPY